MTKIKLENVRLSFPSLFKKATFNGEETKYEATFLIPKSDIKTKELIDEKINSVIKEAKIKVPNDKLCIKDGDDIFENNDNYEGYKDHWSFKASTNKRPTVLNSDKSLLTEEDNKIYGGCYVNAIVDIWPQNNSYGKRINSNLYGVQFVKDGETFGSGDIDVTEEFDDLDDL